MALLGNNSVGAVGHGVDGGEAPCMLLVDLAFARKRCARHFGFVELGWVGVTLAFGPRGGWTMTIGRDGNLRLAADGDPIPGYYPRIIDDALWAKVQNYLRVQPYCTTSIGPR
jgi:hypothetical protein